MKQLITILLLSSTIVSHAASEDDKMLRQQIALLRQQTVALQTQVDQLQKKVVTGPQESAKNTQKENQKHTRTVKTQKTSQNGTKTSPQAYDLDLVSVLPVIPKMKPSQPQMVPSLRYQHSPVMVHTAVDADPESVDFYPTALVAGDHVLTYIAGTP
ncbi:MAG TPA: hypothetical protein VHD33_02330, partial [Legionellaceae bacterium]|nr:hypothetical protein [Legionellaceae bacterium]